MQHLTSKRRLKFSAILALAVVSAATCLHNRAEASVIAYINNGGGSVDYLTNYGHSVTYLNNPKGLTVTDLAGFDAIMIASNFPFDEAENIGNVAAAFADAGGGVVLTCFGFSGEFALGGAIMTDGYSPFSKDPTSNYNLSSNLGAIFDPASPLFAGVNTANVNTIFQADVGLHSQGTLVADWDSGRHAIGFTSLSNSKVVALNFYPASNLTESADEQLLVSNALDFSKYGSGAGPVPEPATIAVWSLIGLCGVGYGVRRRMKKTA